MNQPVWVRRDVIIAYHELLLATHGGASGIRDACLLDSALARPENLFSYGDPTIYELAASYAFGLVKNHPFVDGNKRIGFSTSVLFLELNGLRFRATEVAAVLKTLALAAGELSEEGYAVWLEASSEGG